MDRNEFLDKLGTPNPYNTNNSWGFGGSSGHSYLLENGCIVSLGKTSHRHTVGYSYIRVDVPSEGNYSGSRFIYTNSKINDYKSLLDKIINYKTSDRYSDLVEKYSKYK